MLRWVGHRSRSRRQLRLSPIAHHATVTPRKKSRVDGSYWYTCRCRGGKLRDMCLGKSAELTLERLQLAIRAAGQGAGRGIRQGECKVATGRPGYADRDDDAEQFTGIPSSLVK